MNMRHESLCDIPIIIEFCKRLNLHYIIDEHFPTHGNQEGLSNGLLSIGWIAHILTQNNHCKSPVQQWQIKHKLALESLLETEIFDSDFEDCRLGRLLKKFANDKFWHAFEAAFYKDAFSILDLNIKAPEDFNKGSIDDERITKTIKIDSTTTYGHHTVKENGIMQRGWSKDHRPDLPQLKIMVASEGNTGFQIASDVVPGNLCDDPLYIPIIERTREIIDTKGCLMCGDCKMAAMKTRANIVSHNEFYLFPLALQDSTKVLLNMLIDQVVDGDQQAELIYDSNDKNSAKIIGAGFEFERIQELREINKDQILRWNERVLLVKSYDHCQQEIEKFYDKIKKLKDSFNKLTSKQFSKSEKALKELEDKMKKIQDENELSYLFEVKTEVQMEEREVKRCEVRNGNKREGSYKVKLYRAKVIKVIENKDLIEKLTHKIGWRLYATNAPRKMLSFVQAYKYFRKTMYVIEIGFHKLKDYINISPLYVRDEDQILGLTRFLMLALKILTLMTAELHANMKKQKVVLKGLYAGQPARQHKQPTAESILRYFSRWEIALVGQQINGKWYWNTTELPENCKIILNLLKISETVYESIAIRLQNGL